MAQQAAKIADESLQKARAELIEQLQRALPTDGVRDMRPGITLARSSKLTEHVHSVFTPAFCVIAQGSKRVMLGDEIFRYDPGHYLIATVDLPIVSHVIEASEQKPYFSFRLELDPAVVAAVIMESGTRVTRGDASVKAMDVSPIDATLLDAVVRLMRTLEKPEEIPVIAPLIIKEIVYRLMRGEQGARLGHLLTSGDTRRISKAIGHMRKHFDEPLRMDEIARILGMSVSGFHHHFKSVTAMSPLQYQKQIRLQEARRLMIGEDLDAASAGFRVGYEDPSYFSRDYKKQFGAPPQRDIARIRESVEA
jgi:AraC-like DNA-binding protein